ncbi:SAF domain-containing protein [Sulfobacillus thermosulfidooxidans]|uniref:SAF domain-containing protein n=1 Tax=Sulfobacillus thermosulfidooxidans TaxID=28034 RepID=UPI0006B50D1B|nr:SAF domain-containing protein [Sulfobacillus thermosulfidooxidans]
MATLASSPLQKSSRRTATARLFKVAAGFLGGFALLGIAHQLTIPPHLHTVWILKTSLTPGQPLTAQDVTGIKTLNPWPNALSSIPTGWVAKRSLAPGTPLLRTDFTTMVAFRGLKPGQAMWTIPVSGVSSGLVQVGDRVQVWSDPQSTPQGSQSASTGFAHLWATGVRVMGIYSSSGTPLSNNQTAIGMVSLAVPDRDLSLLMTIANPTLVQDPYQTHFRLVVAPPTTTQTPAPSSNGSKTPGAKTG